MDREALYHAFDELEAKREIEELMNLVSRYDQFLVQNGLEQEFEQYLDED